MKLFFAALILVAGAAQAQTITMKGCPLAPSFQFYTIQMGKLGNVIVTCVARVDPVPTPTPAPTPSPPPPTPVACGPIPSNGKPQPIFPGGSGNYAFDSFNYVNTGKQPGPDPGTTVPAGSIQIYPLPVIFHDGSIIRHGQMVFGDFPLVNNGGTYEVSIAKCPADFDTYKTGKVLGPDQYACGLKYGPNFSIQWASGGAEPFFNECAVPVGEQWYMNWRVHNCPADTGHTCGNIFTIPYTH